jgi:hypothetical protein
MQGLTQWLELELVDVLLEPTFNGLAARANSSFAVSERGVIREPLERGRAELSTDESAYIDREAAAFYERALAAASA